MIERVQELARNRGVIRASDLAEIGASHNYLYWLAKSGRIMKIGRGLYALSDSNLSAQQSLVEISARYPKVTICLLSALAYHQIGTQLPAAVWVAIGLKDRAPISDTAPLVVTRMAPKVLAAGSEVHLIDGVKVNVTGIAKTIVDCFKFRTKVGTDVAIEALKDALRRNLITSDELYHFATLTRMWNVIRPYAEAMACPPTKSRGNSSCIADLPRDTKTYSVSCSDTTTNASSGG